MTRITDSAHEMFWRQVVGGQPIVLIQYDELGLAQVGLATGERFYFYPPRGPQPPGTLLIRECEASGDAMDKQEV